MEDFVKQLLDIKDKIRSLHAERNELVHNNHKTILSNILRMMDWDENDILRASIEYSSFEDALMADIRVKSDTNARYVFHFNTKGKPVLRFREDFVKCHQ